MTNLLTLEDLDLASLSAVPIRKLASARAILQCVLGTCKALPDIAELEKEGC